MMIDDQFNHVDTTGKRRIKPKVAEFVIRRMVDEQPDLSDLEQHLGGQEYADQDNERLRQYNAGQWYMMGVRAEAVFLMDSGGVDSGGGRSAIIQHLSSGGVWGIDSDSDEEYIKSMEREELDQVKQYCKELGIKFNAKTPVTYKQK